MYVAELEASLLKTFPRESAEPWDHVGMMVGDPRAEVVGVAIALDANERTVRLAHSAGANVLLTHHPIAIEPPDTLTPLPSDSSQAGSCLYEAARLGVSVISLHTNLDRSRAARELQAKLVGCSAASSLENAQDPSALGLGALCELDELQTLRSLAQRAGAAWLTEPRVWGDPDRLCRRVAVLGGSLGDCAQMALDAGADVIITGEAGYHKAQDACARGVSLILLGHDRSEEPFCTILSHAAETCGVERVRITTVEAERPWWTAQ